MRERRDRFNLAILPMDAPETAVLIAICSINIHQYDSSYFLVPHVPRVAWPLAKHICTTHHIEVILPTSLAQLVNSLQPGQWFFLPEAIIPHVLAKSI